MDSRLFIGNAVFLHFFAECFAIDSEVFRRLGFVAAKLFERIENLILFKPGKASTRQTACAG
jgi:hypothetical protein